MAQTVSQPAVYANGLMENKAKIMQHALKLQHIFLA